MIENYILTKLCKYLLPVDKLKILIGKLNFSYVLFM